MFEVVEDEQGRRAGQRLRNRPEGVDRAAAADPKRIVDGEEQLVGIRDRGQADEDDRVIRPVVPTCGHLGGQPGLADTTRADHGHQPVGVQQFDERGLLPVPGHQRSGRFRYVAGLRRLDLVEDDDGVV